MAHAKRPLFEMRDGEERLDFDPGASPVQGTLVFIGHIISPWTERHACPKNMAAAREAKRPASVIVDPAYRDGLKGLAGASHVIILSWFEQAPRDLIVQKPAHASQPTGVFALRSPARPNPVGLHVVRLVGLDLATGRLDLEAIDALNGTPVIDIKPYYASVDSVPEAIVDRGGR